MRLPHVVPFSDSPIYFFTACTSNRVGILANAEATQIITGIWQRSAELDDWYVGRFVIMPDHVHFFAAPARGAKSRATWTKLWKSVSARTLARVTGRGGRIWQEDTFDHILRGHDSYAAKWEYVRANPVRARLCAKAEDWPWQGELHCLRFYDE